MGNNYGSNGKNFQIAPPSSMRDHPSRPQFANRFNNFSKSGMHDDFSSNRFNNSSNVNFSSNYKSGAMYDDFMNSRFGDNRFGGSSGFSGGLYGSNCKPMYDDGFCGMGSKYSGM